MSDKEQHDTCCGKHHHHHNDEQHEHCGHHHHHNEAGGHEHTHSHGAATGAAMATPFLLKYMLDHNQHHAKELCGLIRELEDAGHSEAAAETAKALECYEQGNEALARAVQSL